MVAVKPLGDLCRIILGQSPASSSYNQSGEGLPFFQGNADFGVDHPIARTWCTEPKKTAQSGDLLISVRAPIGSINIADCECCIGRGIASLRVNDNVLDMDYLRQCLIAKSADLAALGTGSTFTAVGKAVLNSFEIPIYEIEEQRRIAQHLVEIIRLRRRAEQMLAKADELIQSRFVEMFASDKCKEVLSSELMPNMRNGVSPSKRGTFSAKVLILSAITQGDFDDSAWKEGVFNELPSPDKRVSSSDFYMCRGNGNKGLVGAGAYADRDYPDLVFPDTVIAGRVDTSKVCMPYLFHVWRHPAVRKQIESMARTTNGTFKVNQDILSSIKIPLPSLDLQNEFAEFVTAVESLKSTTWQRLDRLNTLYDSLAQQYFAQ
ncbi:restriction endonuclease subunit S [Bifidobacterium samirii]|uniref:Restriction-modification system specificity determinant n=1 Tax=Bifidobacterium samirii TaxID=2306974 RepID=A0A430FDA9_9BIFI|nr:restriction endonuclease subunit S [Bifidobacterium samirii]RSX50807.1 restriction-modification system specificity determinant [Bifidobacterium samirii]